MARTVFDAMLSDIDREKAPIVDYLASGGVKCIEDYRSAVGQLRGLDTARAIIEKTQKTYEEDE